MTGSEKGHYSMTSGEYGRHSQHPGTWTPEVEYPRTPTHAWVEPEKPAEQTIPGLRKFDLGAIPASVTPPRSWRRAAWFAVGASLAVVAGLFFAASALMGQPRHPATIDALPNYPSMPMFLDTTTSQEPSSETPKPTKATSGSAKPTARPTDGPPAKSTHQPATTTGSSDVPTSTAPSTPQTPVYQPPARETTPKRAFAMSDPKVIGDRTELFYKYVTANPGAAYQMTTGDMYLQGESAFRARYSGIRTVEVRRIGIDPNRGTTTSEVKVTKTDGSTFTEVRELRFTSGGDPKISSEETH
jgi:hypothetical protein